MYMNIKRALIAAIIGASTLAAQQALAGGIQKFSFKKPLAIEKSFLATSQPYKKHHRNSIFGVDGVKYQGPKDAFHINGLF